VEGRHSLPLPPGGLSLWRPRLCLVEIRGKRQVAARPASPRAGGMVVRPTATLCGTTAAGDRTAVSPMGTTSARVCVATAIASIRTARGRWAWTIPACLPLPDRGWHLSHQRFGLDHNRMQSFCNPLRAGSATSGGAPTSGRGWRGEPTAGHSPRSTSPGGRMDACTGLRQVA